MSDPQPAPRRRLDLGGRSLREHAARGTMINGAFQIGLAAVAVSRRFLIAIFLTAADYGLWGLIYAAVATMLWLKDVGIGDKYIQQDEEDQEIAFQKAFTLELIWCGVFALLILIGVPIFALIYGRPEIILPGSLMAVAILGAAFQTPTWIFYREMRFVRQRALVSIEPVVGFVVTLGLGAAGAGYWALVIGAIAGTWGAAAASVIACPYPIRWRFQRGVLKEYYSFSWPLLVASSTGIVTLQTAVLIGNSTVGLAGLGAIGLAGTIANFTDRVDQVIGQTLYPAICAVKDRVDVLYETFTKSNRVAVAWGTTFGFGLALFAPDLVHHILGDKWHNAITLLEVFGVTSGLRQIAFNWAAYFRARAETRPIAVTGGATMVVFVATVIPGMILWGLNGYALAICASVATELTFRAFFLSRLFTGFSIVRHALRSLLPTIPGVLVILGIRQLEAGPRTGLMIVAELVIYLALTLGSTWVTERDLIREIATYLRARPAPAAEPALKT